MVARRPVSYEISTASSLKICYNAAMSQVMVIGILLIIYVLYVITGIHFQFDVAWLDWNAPYFHYAIIEGGKTAGPAFAAPALALVWLGYLWYHKSMIGEA
jgi:hypothetical protein